MYLMGWGAKKGGSRNFTEQLKKFALLPNLIYFNLVNLILDSILCKNSHHHHSLSIHCHRNSHLSLKNFC